MVEIAAVFITFGAVLYEVINMQLDSIFIVAILAAFFIAILLRSKRGLIFSLVTGSLIVLGALAMWRVDVPVSSGVYGPREFEGRIVSVDRRLDRTMVTAKDLKNNENIQLRMSAQTTLLPNDHIFVKGNVVLPENFITDSGRLFDYQKYLESKSIVGIVDNPQITQTTKGKLTLARITTSIRYKVAEIFQKYVSFPNDGILSGMTVGYQGGLPESIQDLFQNTGVLHVLVLSGYNITLLAGFLALLLKGFSFRLQALLTILSILMLVLISGAGVASIRAGIMGSIAITAGITIRKYNPMRALFVSYLLFFLIAPKTIFVDPGFHLSFLATLFIVLVLPKVEKLFSFLTPTRYVNAREIIILAFTIPIFMLPYMMYFSGTFSFVSPIANIILALLIPLVMVFGIVLLTLSAIAPLAQLIGFILSSSLSLLTDILEKISLPLWHTPFISGALVFFTYLIVLALVFQKDIKERLKLYYKALRQQTN